MLEEQVSFCEARKDGPKGLILPSCVIMSSLGWNWCGSEDVKKGIMAQVIGFEILMSLVFTSNIFIS